MSLSICRSWRLAQRPDDSGEGVVVTQAACVVAGKASSVSSATNAAATFITTDESHTGS